MRGEKIKTTGLSEAEITENLDMWKKRYPELREDPF